MPVVGPAAVRQREPVQRGHFDLYSTGFCQIIFNLPGNISGMKKEKPEHPAPEQEKPPVMGSWKNLYILLVVVLVVQIVLYYLITISFR